LLCAANEKLVRKVIFLLMLFVFACGCSRKVYVPVEHSVIRTDTVTHYINDHDSITVIERIYESDTRYDSIAPMLDSLGRVIGWDRYHFRERTKKDEREIRELRALVDSLRESKAKVDSVPYPVEVPVEVERKISGWERFVNALGHCMLGAIFCAIMYVGVRLIRKR